MRSTSDQNPGESERLAKRERITVAVMTGDYLGAHALRRDLDFPESSAVKKELVLAVLLARAHDNIGASRALALAAARAHDPDELVSYWTARIYQHLGQENWTAAIIAYRRLQASVGGTSQPLATLAYHRTQIGPFIDVAHGRLGDLVAARERIFRLPEDCYPCMRARAQLAELGGDQHQADHWFAKAVRQSPRLPFAYAEWGRALLVRGNAAGAISLFAKATHHGPRFADSYKFWGDAYSRQGKYRDAIGKYAAAADRAPRWAQLHLDWGLALQRMGHHDVAREKLELASSLGVPAGDVPRLRQALGTHP